jgi:hypothetical protein
MPVALLASGAGLLCLLAGCRPAGGRDLLSSGVTCVPAVVTGARLRAGARAGR